MRKRCSAIIGPDLAAKALQLSGEDAWEPASCREVISKLRDSGLAVVGVELWNPQGSDAKWIASSNYNCPESSGWPAYVRCCAEHALAFVDRFGDEPEALFNLSWSAETETGA
ncbi:MAG TPA: hypothetical protein VLU25_14720 [Acidobacteriota bacterium]|nr:hypothetical protein [Acidobacteriota bacterium]